MIYPLTEILKPGPISNGTEEKSALLATAFELIEERREWSRENPSLVELRAVAPAMGAGASGSKGLALYIMSCICKL